MKIQPCNKGCRTLITVQMDPTDSKYKPYEVDQGGEIITDNNGNLQKHNCPNSEYNKNKGQGQQPQQESKGIDFSKLVKTQTAHSIPINNPTLEAVILNQISQKLDIMKKQMEEAIEAKLVEIMEYCKNNNLMGDAMIAHFGITQPTTAAELYQRQQNQNPQQEEEQKVYGWNSVPNPTDNKKEDQIVKPFTEDDQDVDPSDKELEDQGI